MNDLRGKALGYLRAGAVEVVTGKPTVMAFVQGHARRHVVDGRHVGGDGEVWECTCPRGATDPTCPHRAAVQLVTGGLTDIRPEERQ